MLTTIVATIVAAIVVATVAAIVAAIIIVATIVVTIVAATAVVCYVLRPARQPETPIQDSWPRVPLRYPLAGVAYLSYIPW